MSTLESSAAPSTGRTKSNGISRGIGSTSSRSSTHTESALSSSFASTRSHSSSPSRNHDHSQHPTQQQQQPNESTPINAGDTSRRYGSTERTADPQTRGTSGQAKTTNNGGDINTGLPDYDAQNGHPVSPSEPHRPWYSRVADRYGSLELDNKGSVARDHLALERTFLAWMRTSLAFASIGIAVTQLFRLNNTSAPTSNGKLSVLSNAPPAVLPSLYDGAITPLSGGSTGLRSVGKPLGTTFIGVAILILVVGFHRYFEAQYWIVRGKFPASRGSVALTAFAAASLIVAALAVILAVSQ